MANPYDVSTVVSRSYISEQLQDHLQKGAEQRGAHFLNEFQKQSDQKTKTVQKADKADNPVISKEAVKLAEERKKKREKQNRDENREKKNKTSKIDMKV